MPFRRRIPPNAADAGSTRDDAGADNASSLRTAFYAHAFARADAPDARVDADAASAFRDAASRFDPARLPRLPALLPQLLAAMRRDATDAQALAALVARDAVLAGELVRIANTAFYSRGRRIAGLLPAVQLLGHDGLRRFALGVLMRPLVGGEGGDPSVQQRLWRHAQRCMVAAPARAAPGVDVAALQLAAIASTTGLAALARTAPASLWTHPRHADAWTTHALPIAADLCARAARHWDFGADVVETLATAHRPSPPGALARALRDGDALSMAAALEEAGQLDAALPQALVGDPALRARVRDAAAVDA